MELEVRDPQEFDLAYIARHMRREDRDECARGAKLSPLEALFWSVERSLDRHIVVVDDEPVAAYGLSQWATGEHAPWMLGTDTLNAYPLTTVRFARRIMHEWRNLTLVNYVDDQNERSKRFLEILGFSLDEYPVFLNGSPFRRFSRVC